MMERHLDVRPLGEGSTYRPDPADFQQLIRYVERWRLAHFQRRDERVREADELLKKLRRGMAAVTEEDMGGMGAQTGSARVS